MRRLIPVLGLLTIAVLAAGPAAAQSQGSQGLTQGLSDVRASGCGGRAGVPQPLREVPALSDVARRLAQGRSAEEAMREAGYRANRWVQMSLGGYGSVPALVDAVSSRYCDSLLDPGLEEVGIHRQGQRTWIVLANPFSPPEAARSDEVSREVLALVNQARSQPRRCGSESFPAAGSLQWSPALHRAAEVHARDMARHGFLGHTGSDGSKVGQRATRAGFDWRDVGENVAAGQQTARAVVQGWLNSPEHCANLMHGPFTHMGVAFAVDEASRGGIYWAQVFGRPR
ncbi:CAP domain-containing protein [Ramlibacter sp. AW1]|uniref:CAP domain-containing protein n=1 Tax=Ramlibacter aurantiacus TaxID=2801330 RepID=A0A936ZTK5_9BURK|nr:CAP domain-containing protein [Ramlibacter aurantiacus]MBL0423385.1 CAP domain-containing protein [Ramlibacter aurantiacus]